MILPWMVRLVESALIIARMCATFGDRRYNIELCRPIQKRNDPSIHQVILRAYSHCEFRQLVFLNRLMSCVAGFKAAVFHDNGIFQRERLSRGTINSTVCMVMKV